MARGKPLNILQWNSRGISNKQSSLEKMSNNYHIILLNVTWLKPHSKFYLRNFNIIRKDRPSRPGGGLLTAIRNDIPFKQVELGTNIDHKLELLAIAISTEFGQILIVNIYENPRTSTHNLDWTNFWTPFQPFLKFSLGKILIFTIILGVVNTPVHQASLFTMSF